MAIKLINSKYNELIKRNGPDLVNRYFDVMTIQKSVTTLLTGGVAVFLNTFVGLILLAFYHPYFLVFDILLIFSLWLVWVLFRKDALASAIDESKAKYKAASWLKELSRANLFFKSRSRKDDALVVADNLINKYLDHRRLHFRQVFYQTILLLVIYALMSALILALGGYLVIKGQLTLGQLVAAELVVTVILASFSKAGKYLESFYDMYAAIDKISDVYDLPAEENMPKLDVEFDKYDLNFNHASVVIDQNKFEFDFKFKQGEKYFVYPRFNSAKLVFIEIIRKLIDIEKGYVRVGEYGLDEISPIDLRELIYVVDSASFFEGTIFDNLTIGKNDLSRSKVTEALEVVDLQNITDIFEDGLDTKIYPSGHPLWSSQHIRLELARVILMKPKIVVVTEVFDQIENNRRKKILEHLMSLNITLIVFGHKEVQDLGFDEYLLFQRENIMSFSSEDELRKVVGEQ